MGREKEGQTKEEEERREGGRNGRREGGTEGGREGGRVERQGEEVIINWKTLSKF